MADQPHAGLPLARQASCRCPGPLSGLGPPSPREERSGEMRSPPSSHTMACRSAPPGPSLQPGQERTEATALGLCTRQACLELCWLAQTHSYTSADSHAAGRAVNSAAIRATASPAFGSSPSSRLGSATAGRSQRLRLWRNAPTAPELPTGHASPAPEQPPTLQDAHPATAAG